MPLRSPPLASIRHQFSCPIAGQGPWSSWKLLSNNSRSFSSQQTPNRVWRRRYGIVSISGATILSIPLMMAAGGEVQAASPLSAEGSTHPSTPPTNLSRTSIISLMRTYLVFTITSFPIIVDNSPRILSILTHSWIPGVRTLTEWSVRQTFFKQFVGGETVDDCYEIMSELRDRGIGTLLNYSVEVGEEHTPREPLARRSALESTPEMKELLRAIEQAGTFERNMQEHNGRPGETWLAVKITGLTNDPGLLHRASNTILRLRASNPKSPSAAYPGTPSSLDTQVVARPQCYGGNAFSGFAMMNGACGDGGVLEGEEGVRAEGDEEALRFLWSELKVIGQRAKENGIKLAIDAEHSWYQPALDVYTMMLSQEFNKIQPQTSDNDTSPLVYGTYQGYLTRTPAHLEASLAHAKINGYVLGVKLVRGAYHEQEQQRWIREGRDVFGPDPIWKSKDATDLSYNGALDMIMTQISDDVRNSRPLSVGVLFGTHNVKSCDMVISQLKAKGLVRKSSNGSIRPIEQVRGSILMAQLYGMSDALTDRIAETFDDTCKPVVLKYLPYGKLAEVLPYLGRRAVENKALLSGDSGTAAERRRVSQELWRRLGWA